MASGALYSHSWIYTFFSPRPATLYHPLPTTGLGAASPDTQNANTVPYKNYNQRTYSQRQWIKNVLPWPFLMTTLSSIGLHGPFLSEIQHLHSTHMATINMPLASSPMFAIHNGARQRCPLSSLLFFLCIESLASTIIHSLNIKGVSVCGNQ